MWNSNHPVKNKSPSHGFPGGNVCSPSLFGPMKDNASNPDSLSLSKHGLPPQENRKWGYLQQEGLGPSERAWQAGSTPELPLLATSPKCPPCLVKAEGRGLDGLAWGKNFFFFSFAFLSCFYFVLLLRQTHHLAPAGLEFLLLQHPKCRDYGLSTAPG